MDRLCLVIPSVAILLAVTAAAGKGTSLPTSWAAEPNYLLLPKGEFEWKALWAWMSPSSDANQVRRMVEQTQQWGFNVLIVNTTGGGLACYESNILKTPPGRKGDPFREAVAEARRRNIQVYGWVSYLSNSGLDTLYKQHPEYYQVVKPEEEAEANRPQINPDRPNIMLGKWLSPDRGLADHEKRITEEIVRGYDLDGIAIDFLGYRNYKADYGEFSTAKRQEYAQAHPELSEAEVLRRVSEQSLAAWTGQLREAVHAVKPGMKLAIHVYPDFDLNPLYGNLLPVEYCGQTIAWFYKPHWSLEKVSRRQEEFLAAQGRNHAFQTHVPFVGVRLGDVRKSPDRLRAEIRIAGRGGCKNIMVAFHETLDRDPELARVVAEELR